jgi:hypothetical protein
VGDQTGAEQAVLIQSYPANEAAQAVRAYSDDAAKLYRDGWRVVSSCWIREPRGFGHWGVIRVFSRPAGMLVVTYQR